MKGVLLVRPATPADLAVIERLIDGYAVGHAAEGYARPAAALEGALFGAVSRSRILIAEKHGEAVGFGAWRSVFDLLWAKYGGEMDGLYVNPAHRGQGIAARIVAAACADIRQSGGVFLRATYTGNVGRLYERLAVATERRECHLSARAFETLADLNGCGPREVIRRLPLKR